MQLHSKDKEIVERCTFFRHKTVCGVADVSTENSYITVLEEQKAMMKVNVKNGKEEMICSLHFSVSQILRIQKHQNEN